MRLEVSLIYSITLLLQYASSFRSAFLNPARHGDSGLVTIRRIRRSHCQDTSSVLYSDKSLNNKGEDYPKVLCVGEALFDCIASDDAIGWSVDEMMQQQRWDAYPGGAVANVATACCKLGTATTFLGCVGNDTWGDDLITLFHDIGVDTRFIQRSSTYPTRRVMVTRSITGDRAFGAFYNNLPASDFSDCYLNSDLLLNTDNNNNFEQLLDNTKWIVSGTLGLAFPVTSMAIYSILDKAAATNKQIFVDVNWRPVFWDTHKEEEVRQIILQFSQTYATIIKLTDEEVEWLVGIPASDALSNPQLVHNQFFPNAKAVLVTAGEKGASYSVFDCTGFIEPMIDPVAVVETTGAGDAFSAGFLHGLVSKDLDLTTLNENDDRKRIIDDIVRAASAAGGLTCTKAGAIAAQPTLYELDSFLCQYNIKTTTPAT